MKLIAVVAAALVSALLTVPTVTAAETGPLLASASAAQVADYA